ncbi:tetratricopeptide repeat protein, partial [Thermodesulfobacteriota bacterium]
FFAGNISISRQALIDAGMFDDDFGGRLWAAEDIELGYRLYRNGCNIIYNRRCLVWHAQQNSPESFASIYTRRGGGGVRMFAKHPEMPCHYTDITAEAVMRWKFPDARLARLVDELEEAVARSDALAVPDSMPTHKPFSEQRCSLGYKQQWVLADDVLYGIVRRLLAETKSALETLGPAADAKAFFAAAEQLYPAINFLKWHYDTRGIAQSPWIDDYIRKKASLAAQKSSAQIFFRNSGDTPFVEIFKRKTREGNMPWYVFLHMAGLLLGQQQTAAPDKLKLSEGAYCLERTAELKPCFLESLTALQDLYSTYSSNGKGRTLDQKVNYLHAHSSNNGKNQIAYDYLSKKDYDKALLYFSEALHENNRDFAALFELCDLNLRNNCLDTAESILNMLAASTNGSNPFGFLLCEKQAEIAFLRGDYEKTTHATAAAAPRSMGPTSLNLLAEAKLKGGLTDEAAELWQASLQANPLQIPVYLKLFDAVTDPASSDHEKAPCVNIILATRNIAGACRATLEHLLQTINDTTHIIVLMPQNDAARTIKASLTTLAPREQLHVVTHPADLDSHAAKRWVLQQPVNDTADFIVFLDDDIRLPADWLQTCMATFQRYPESSLVCGKIVQAGSLKKIYSIYRFIDSVCASEVRFLNMFRHTADMGQFDFIRTCFMPPQAFYMVKTVAARSACSTAGNIAPEKINPSSPDVLLAFSGHELIYNGHLEITKQQVIDRRLDFEDVAFKNGSLPPGSRAVSLTPQFMLDVKEQSEERDRRDIIAKIEHLRREGFLQNVPEIPFGIV